MTAAARCACCPHQTSSSLDLHPVKSIFNMPSFRELSAILVPHLRLSISHPEAHCSIPHLALGDTQSQWAHSSSSLHAHSESQLSISKCTRLIAPKPACLHIHSIPISSIHQIHTCQRPHQIHHVCLVAKCSLQSVELAAFWLRSALHLDTCLCHTQSP